MENQDNFKDRLYYSFLQGNDIDLFEKEYMGLEKELTDSNILRIQKKGKTIVGSNPFSSILTNNLLEYMDIRVATPKDVERISEYNRMVFEDTYVNSGLLLVDNKEKNKYDYNSRFVRRSLLKQLIERDIFVREENPVLIAFSDLTLAKNEKSYYGLEFKIKEDAKIIPAKSLCGNKMFYSEDSDEDGIPIPSCRTNNSHIVLPSSNGLSVYETLFQSNKYGQINKVINVKNKKLEESTGTGRIVLVSDEETSLDSLYKFSFTPCCY